MIISILPLPLSDSNLQLNGELLENFICLHSRLITFYVFYFIPFHRLIINKQFLKFAAGFVTSMLALTVLILLLVPPLEWIYKDRPINFNFSTSSFAFNFSYYFIYALFGFFFRSSLEWYHVVNSKKELEKQQVTSELSTLRAQVNPHFLFNTLNNIHSFIEVNPPQAGDYVLKLSEIMRYMLYDSNAEIVSLDKEINYLKSYIELQRLRLTNPDYVQFHISGNTESLPIAPMLLIPLVENAFKHSTKKSLSQGIIIKLECQDRLLNFEVSNPVGKTLSKDERGNGVGLTNLNRRLELLYPDQFTLESTNDGSVFNVKLEIKL